MLSDAEVLADETAVEQAKEYLRQGETVEFFERVASRLLKHQPQDPVPYCLEYVEMLRNDGNSVDPEAATTYASPVSQRTDDAKYTKAHKVSDFLDKWILAFVAEKPGSNVADAATAKSTRLEFHRQYLTRMNEQGRGK